MSDVTLLQTLLAAEHAAVYAYDVLGPRLPDAVQPRARAAQAAHRALRDRLTALLRARAAQAPGTAAGYDVAAAGPAEALALAVRVEEGVGVRWRDLVAGTDAADLRTLGTSGLVDAAVRAARWRATAGAPVPTVALPGTAAPDPTAATAGPTR